MSLPNKLLLMESEHYNLEIVKKSLLAQNEFENSDEQTLLLEELGEKTRLLLGNEQKEHNSPKIRDPKAARDAFEYVAYRQKFVERTPPIYARWRDEHKSEFIVKENNVTTTYPGITWEEYTNFLNAYQRKSNTFFSEIYGMMFWYTAVILTFAFNILFLLIPLMYLPKRTTIYRNLAKKFETHHHALVRRRVGLIRHDNEVEELININPRDYDHTHHINLGQLFQVEGTLFKLAGYVSGDETVLMLRQEFSGKDGAESNYINRFNEPKLTILTLDEFCKIYTGTGLDKSTKWWNDRTLFVDERWA